MGLFGFGKNKQQEINNASRIIVLNKINEITNSINYNAFPDAREMIEGLRNVTIDLQKHPQSNSPELVVCDALLTRYLNDMQADMKAGNGCTAGVRLKALKEALNTRANFASKDRASIGADSKVMKKAQKLMERAGKKNGLLKPEEIELTIGDIYNDEQLYEINLQGYQDKVNVLTKEIQGLKEKRTMDMATQMMIARKTGELTNAKNLLQEFGNNEYKNYMLTMMKEFNDVKKENMSKCMFDDAEIKEIMQAYKEGTQVDQTVTDIMGMMSGQQQSFDMGASFGQASQQAQGIDEAKYADIQKEIAELDRACQTYQSEIDKASREMTRIGNEALRLIQLKKQSNDAEQKALDPKIRSLQNQYNSYDRRIKLLEQNRVKADNELTMAREIFSNIEVQRINSKVQSSSMNYQNLQQKAMDLSKAVEQANEALAESNEATLVGLSNDYDTDSATDMGMSSETEGANINEFDGFEELLQRRG